jgi:predicted dienelactone hydrolase
MKVVPIVLTCLALIAGGCASSPDPAAPSQAEDGSRGYSPEPGQNAVGVIPEGSLRDDQRNKDLELSIDYPIRGGPYPVIIFSHGFGGSKSGYIGLAAHWTSNGYVVIRPTHADSGALRQALSEQREENPNRTVRERIDAAETVWEAQGAADWENRARDISFIIDSLAVLEDRYPELKGRMDHTRVGVGGHSYGAFTAMLLAGVRSTAIAKSLADPRVRAVIAMSPPGTSVKLGLTRDSFRDVKIPMLYMTGTEDRGLAESETPDWRREPFEYGPTGDQYLVVISGARHATFTGRMLPPREELVVEPTNPTDPRRLDPSQRPRRNTTMGDPLRERNLFGVAKIAALAFWEAYLKEEADAKAYLPRLERMNAEIKMK